MIRKLFLLTIVALAPLGVVSAEFVSLSKDLPGGGDGALFGGSIYKMLNSLLTISIGVSAVLAVIMLTIGGFKYMTSESIFNIGSAKDQIQNAIIGLIIVLVAVLLLSIINPDIVKLKLFQ